MTHTLLPQVSDAMALFATYVVRSATDYIAGLNTNKLDRSSGNARNDSTGDTDEESDSDDEDAGTGSANANVVVHLRCGVAWQSVAPSLPYATTLPDGTSMAFEDATAAHSAAGDSHAAIAEYRRLDAVDTDEPACGSPAMETADRMPSTHIKAAVRKSHVAAGEYPPHRMMQWRDYTPATYMVLPLPA